MNRYFHLGLLLCIVQIIQACSVQNDVVVNNEKITINTTEESYTFERCLTENFLDLNDETILLEEEYPCFISDDLHVIADLDEHYNLHFIITSAVKDHVILSDSSKRSIIINDDNGKVVEDVYQKIKFENSDSKNIPIYTFNGKQFYTMQGYRWVGGFTIDRPSRYRPLDYKGRIFRYQIPFKVSEQEYEINFSTEYSTSRRLRELEISFPGSP